MSVASTKFAGAAFTLVEVLIVVAVIALHLAIIYIVLALPIGKNNGARKMFASSTLPEKQPA